MEKNFDFKVGDLISADDYTFDECMKLIDMYEAEWVAVGVLRVKGIKGENDEK